MDYSVHGVAAALVAAFFLITGVIELFMWRRFVDRFVAWGYPTYWPIVTYGLKIAGGVLTFWLATRTIGLAICAAISIAAVATILYNRDRKEYKAIPVNILVLVLISVSLATALA